MASKGFNMILADSVSSVDILFKSTLDEIRIVDLRLKGFRGGRLTPLE